MVETLSNSSKELTETKQKRDADQAQLTKVNSQLQTNKNDLQVHQKQLADFQEKEISKIAGNSARAARERFRALGRTYFHWAKKEPHLFNLMFGDFCSLEKSPQNQREENRAFVNLTKCLDELYEFDLISDKMRPFGELLSWSAVHGATSLIIGGHLEVEDFETTLDAVELALGIKG